MSRFVRLAMVSALVAGLLPTALMPVASAHHDNPPECASERISGYIPVAQDDPLEATNLHYQVFIPKNDPDGDGKFPAVMDYSGYQPGLHIWDGLDDHFTCEGYAVIGLNIRGTGCSGGDFDYFEPRQAEDGREAIEWLHNQPWSNGRIAMVGKSYPGITQLFVAGQGLAEDGKGEPEPMETPEGLVAIVPGHVFGDLYRDVPYPGGILNVTFAAGWSAGRIYEPFQAPLEDQFNRQEVDQQCTRNTADHVANPPQNPFVKATYNHYDDDPMGLFRQRSPWTWAENINVPTFLIEAWQDEQVGSRATNLMERFRDGLPVRALFTNGDHGEYYGNNVLPKIDEFLRFYLAEEIPASYQGGTVEEPLPTPTPSPSPTKGPKRPKKPKPTPTPTPSPSTTTRPETYSEALARYEAADPVQLNWENGAGGGRVPAWKQTYASWPPPNQEAWRLNLTPDGQLTQGAPVAGEVDYRYQPGSSQQRGGFDIAGEPPASWEERPAEGTVAQFETDALSTDKVLAGSASVDLTVSSTAPDTDFQVTMTEIRPDGQEMFVQQGWLRASHRAENPEFTTELRPYQTHELPDAQPLVPTQPAELRIEIFPFAHVFRAGSKLRIYVEAPHVKPDLWGFALLPLPATNTIHTLDSSIALPLLEGDTAKTGYAECGRVRSQPCRAAL
ncbi:MAG TPA: CocE/NonD family hydrolase [Actinomycetota bacterium]|nr:CocE/NonD family hydrolase [Actinomycetota bacterium]